MAPHTLALTHGRELFLNAQNLFVHSQATVHTIVTEIQMATATAPPRGVLFLS